VNLHVVDHSRPGAGDRTLLLVHGYLAASHVWEPAAPLLAERSGWRVLAVDLPGAGFSDRPRDRSYSLEWLGHVVAGLASELSTSPVVLCGHSLGGAVAVRAAAERPDRVAGLALVSPLSYRTPVPRILRPASHFPGFFQRFFRTVGRPLIKPAFRKNFAGLPRSATEEAIRTAIAHLDAPGGWHAATRMGLGAAWRTPVEPLLERLAVPALVLWGRDDPVHPPAFAPRLVEDLADAGQVLFDRCGHNPHLEHPERFADAVAGWLERTAWTE